MKIGIYILNYNGKELLGICLPSIIDAVKKSKHACRIVVADNLSVDESEKLVRTKFPGVEFRTMKENKVLCSFNDVAADSDEEVVLFLNNDLKADPGFIDPLVDVFNSGKDVFLSVPCCYSFDGGKIEVSKTIPVYKWGLLKGVPAPEGEKIKSLTYTLQGGFGAFDRRKFMELGGYDDMYRPGIIEDTDLCLRAWKKGYVCYYQPASIIYHMGSVSFKKAFGMKRLLALSHRNTYLFAWKNIDNAAEIVKHIFFIPIRLAYSLCSLKPEILSGFFAAIKMMPVAILRRKSERSVKYKYTMREALHRISGRPWGEFYSDPASDEDFAHNITIHDIFLAAVMKDKPKKLIEIGSGSGTMAAFLSLKADTVVSIDNDDKVLKTAIDNSKKFNGKAEFKKDDAFNLSFKENSFDVAFSQGFFEHFSDDDIRKLIKEQLRVARKVVFSVPTVYYRHRDFGNERLLSMRAWRNILKGFKVVDDRYYMYMRRKKNFLLKLPMMYMATIER